jgi:hypothetical protein
MLRRYLITNGVSSALLYLAVLAYAPSPAALTKALHATFETFVMGQTFLSPVFNRVISIGAGVLGLD